MSVLCACVLSVSVLCVSVCLCVHVVCDCVSVLSFFSELAVACLGSIKVYDTDTAQPIVSFSSTQG